MINPPNLMVVHRAGDTHGCWLCSRRVADQTLFCSQCGVVQPPRPCSHFARLGLAPRYDIDLIALQHRYDALRRSLGAARFAMRGSGEQGFAARQLEALAEAYRVLADPVLRARYWLAEQMPADLAGDGACPELAALRAAIGGDLPPAQLDRLARTISDVAEARLLQLMQALRTEQWSEANQLLQQIEQLDELLASAREQRGQNKPPRGGEAELTAVPPL